MKGWWSTNIGNSLFQISAKGIFEELGMDVVSVPDAPGFINVRKGNPTNYFDFNECLDVDYFCIHGPSFRKEFDKIYLQSLSKLSRRGVKVISLGAGCMDYDPSMMKYYQDWIKACNINVITTRDERTYDYLKEAGSKIYSGIDLGFLISYYAPQPAFLNAEKVVCFNFDQIPEPVFQEDTNGVIAIDNTSYSYKKSFSREPRGMAKKLFPYIRPYLKTFQQREIDGKRIIRLDHRFNPYSRKKIYSDANTFAMDVPDGYLMAYANSQITLSNRVHANVATLSYGNRSMYFSDSKRALLLDRIGLSEIYNRPMSLDQDKLLEEKTKLLEFLKETL